MKHLIVGGGMAACSALKAIRTHDPNARITVISEEKDCFYYRPMTPLMVQGERERLDLMYEPPLEPWVFDLIHERAVSLDQAKSQITLADGRGITFDRLLITTGSAPFIPEIPGIDRENVYFLRTLKDSLKLKEAAKIPGRAVIVGGGLVGIKMATALQHRGFTVTVVEMANQILIPRIDEEGAAMIAEQLSRNGISLLTGETVKEILPDKGGVLLSSGRVCLADIVVIATGVRPNIGWLKDSGLAAGKGIIVDDRMRTSVPNVFAAGDVVEYADMVSGLQVVSGLFSNAVDMGRVAGTNMAGVKLTFPGLLEVLNATEISGVAMVSVGDVLAAGVDSEVYSFKRGNVYRKLVIRNDQLTGAVFVGDIDRAGIYTALIRSGRKLGRLKDKTIRHTLTSLDCFKMN